MGYAPKRHSLYHVYMVRCADGTYYAGYTHDLEARLKQHNAGRGSKYVRWKRPAELVYAKVYRYYKRALLAEWDLKRHTRKQKEALVRAYAAADARRARSRTPA